MQGLHFGGCKVTPLLSVNDVLLLTLSAGNLQLPLEWFTAQCEVWELEIVWQKLVSSKRCLGSPVVIQPLRRKSQQSRDSSTSKGVSWGGSGIWLGFLLNVSWMRYVSYREADQGLAVKICLSAGLGITQCSHGGGGWGEGNLSFSA